MAEFSKLSKVFEEIERIQSRNEMTKILASFYDTLSTEEVQIVSYMVSGRVAPMFLKAEFNYSDKSMINLLKSLVKSKGYSFNTQKEYSKTGDIGDLVFSFLSFVNSKSSGLSISEIYEYLWKIINTTGEKSVERKNSLVSACLNMMSPEEGKYFVRTICGDLRLGVNVKTLLDVFSFCVSGDKSLREELDRAYGVSADIGYIASRTVKYTREEAEKNLSEVKITPGIPILSRLVERVASFSEVLQRMGSPVLVQPKFDGLRCQIHKYLEKREFENFDVIWKNRLEGQKKNSNLFDVERKEERVVLFTRNLEDVTEMFPEIVESAEKLEEESFVLDSEILGWNYKKDTFLSYQETMQRRRKYSVGKKMEDIPVQAMIFDILYLNGRDLTRVDTKDRIGILNEKFKNTREGIRLSPTDEVSNEEELEEEFEKYIAKGLEGIIVKQEKGEYKAGFRNYEWIKMKKSMKKGLVDTIDMVIVGYFKGMGRRTDLGLGAFLGAVFNEEEETFDVVCKVGTGLTDEMIRDLSKVLDENSIEKRYKDVRGGEEFSPDVWVKPSVVVTIEADEITRNLSKSKNSSASGLSLRFPRLVDIRSDKNIEDITTVSELTEMFEIQKNN
jgi:DNA ligase-1